MPKQNSSQSRHLGSFWPIMIIFILAAFVGGLVVVLAFNSGLQDQIDSLVPIVHQSQKKPMAKTAAKMVTASPTKQK